MLVNLLLGILGIIALVFLLPYILVLATVALALPGPTIIGIILLITFGWVIKKILL